MSEVVTQGLPFIRRQGLSPIDAVILSMVDLNAPRRDEPGIKGIPFVYINDREIMGEINFEEIEPLIKIELERIED